MKQFIIHEAAWVLIAFAAFGLLSVLAGMKEPLIIGMLVYSAVRISYLYGLTQSKNYESRRY